MICMGSMDDFWTPDTECECYPAIHEACWGRWTAHVRGEICIICREGFHYRPPPPPPLPFLVVIRQRDEFQLRNILTLILCIWTIILILKLKWNFYLLPMPLPREDL
jgi:E3 ubiquitin-protein ligase DOA10